MADFPNSTTALKFRQPAHSRRLMLRFLAAGLVGASVPVAAIAGAAARKLTSGDDTELLKRCQEWQERHRRLKRIEKELRRLHDEAQGKMPPKPQALFEPIELDKGPPSFIRRPDDGGAGPSGLRPSDGSWARDRLELWARARPSGFPSADCQAHARKLMALLDEYEDTAERLLVPYRRMDRLWERDNEGNWQLFKRIIRTRAATLHGAAAQLKVIELEGVLTNPGGEAINEHVLRVARNIRRLVASQSA
jgi:hypothetical protein